MIPGGAESAVQGGDMLDGLDNAAFLATGMLLAVAGATFCIRLVRRYGL